MNYSLVRRPLFASLANNHRLNFKPGDDIRILKSFLIQAGPFSPPSAAIQGPVGRASGALTPSFERHYHGTNCSGAEVLAR